MEQKWNWVEKKLWIDSFLCSVFPYIKNLMYKMHVQYAATAVKRWKKSKINAPVFCLPFRRYVMYAIYLSLKAIKSI